MILPLMNYLGEKGMQDVSATEHALIKLRHKQCADVQHDLMSFTNMKRMALQVREKLKPPGSSITWDVSRKLGNDYTTLDTRLAAMKEIYTSIVGAEFMYRNPDKDDVFKSTISPERLSLHVMLKSNIIAATTLGSQTQKLIYEIITNNQPAIIVNK